MLPIIYSFIAATVFGVASLSVYGTEGFVNQPWIGCTLLTVLVVGLAVGFLGEVNKGLFCKLSHKYQENQWLNHLCHPDA